METTTLTATLAIGSRLQNGKYEIKAVLGQGGFGITYSVYHTLLNQTFALKEFFPETYCNRDGSTSHVTLASQSSSDLVTRLRARFLSEARNLSRLSHPNIIKVHDVFEENGTAYFLMDYVEGHSLEEIAQAQGTLSENDALNYIFPIASALDHVHHNRMTHLDVKPANIMVRAADGVPVLIDFGLSKQFNDQGHANSTMLMGMSHGYSPIEQYYDGGISGFSPQSDVYALGATLYRLVAGRVPPAAPLLVDEPIQLPLNVSERLSEAIRWAMTSKTTERCPSVRDFRDVLNGNINAPGSVRTQLHINQTNPVGEGYADHSSFNQEIAPHPQPADHYLKPKRRRKDTSLSTTIWVAVICSVIVGTVCFFAFYKKPSEKATTTAHNNYRIEDTRNNSSSQKSGSTSKKKKTAPAKPQVAEAPAFQGIFSGIADAAASTRNGKRCHYYEGVFSDGNRNYPVMFCFVEESSGSMSVVYKNVAYGAQMTMNVTSFDSNSMSLQNSKNGFYVTLYTTGSDVLTGSASQGSNNLDVRITPTYDSF